MVTGAGKVIGPQDWKDAADTLGCNVNVIRAVADVEAPGGGYLSDGRVKILFEPHWFHRLTGGKYDGAYPDLSYRRWGEQPYGTYSKQHDKLEQAVKLDRPAALQSCSWGRFQIMGFNHRKAGHPELQDFVNAMILGGEPAHLAAFVEYVKAVGLADELQRLDWVGFAVAYNGPEHWKNDYVGKMQRRFAMLERQS